MPQTVKLNAFNFTTAVNKSRFSFNSMEGKLIEKQGILEGIETELQSTVLSPVGPMLCDKWIASSAMQKAIRRGDLVAAQSAGKVLWSADPTAFWRRLHIISVEDIGVADVDTVTGGKGGNHANSKRGRIRNGLYVY